MSEKLNEYPSPREIVEDLAVKKEALSSVAGREVFMVEAYSSVLVDRGVNDPQERRDLIATHYGVIFPSKLV